MKRTSSAPGRRPRTALALAALVLAGCRASNGAPRPGPADGGTLSEASAPEGGASDVHSPDDVTPSIEASRPSDGPGGMQDAGPAPADAWAEGPPVACAAPHDGGAAPRLLGALSSFGGFRGEDRPVQGLAALLSADRVVFVDGPVGGVSGSALSLVRVGSDGLELADRALSPVALEVDPVGAFDWAWKPFTHVVPLTTTSFALVGRQRVEAFEVVSDRLQPRGTARLDGLRIEAATGGGDKLWICGTYDLRSVTIAAGVLRHGPKVPLPPGLSCTGAALAPNGRTLLLATTGGVLEYDVSGGETPLLTRTGQKGTMLRAVQTDGSRVVVQKWEPFGALGALLVLDASNLSVLSELAPATLKAPLGFSLTDGGLVVEWYDWQMGRAVTSAGLYTWSASGAEPIADLVVRDFCCGGDVWTPVPVSPSGRGSLTVLQPWRQVLRADPAARALRSLTGPLHGSFDRLVPLGTGKLLALGQHSSHVVDLSDPTRPTATRGGIIASGPHPRLRALLPATSHGLELIGVPVRVETEQRPGNEALALYGVDDDGEISSRGEWPLPEARALLQSAGDSVYQVRRLEGGGFGVRRLRVTAAGAPPAQELDATASLDSPVVPRAPYWAFGVGREGRALAIAEDLPSGTQSRIGWFERTGATLTRRGTFDVSFSATAVAVAGDRAIVLGQSHVALLRAEGDRLRQEATSQVEGASQGRRLRRLLAFDGQTVYAAGSRLSPGSSAGVMALSGPDLSVRRVYETPDDVLSLAFVGRHVVFGSKTGLVVAEPTCPPSP